MPPVIVHFFDRENMNDYGSFPRPRSLPLATHAEDQDMTAAAANAGITRQTNITATAKESLHLQKGDRVQRVREQMKTVLQKESVHADRG